jgi:hypothetical protein
MREQQTFYDFHGLVGMQIINRGKGGLAGFANLGDPFASLQVDALPGVPDVTLDLGEFEAYPEDCYLVDHKYHVRRNYLYCEDGWQGFRWKVEIEGFESGPTTIRLAMRGGGLRGALVPGLYSKMLLTRQLLAYKLHEKGCLLAHAAGAARDGRAVVIFGRGGSYKTSVLMSLLRSSPEWCALGDDGVILKGDQALCFPTYTGLFAYRLAHGDNEYLTSIDRLRYMLKPSSTADAGEHYTLAAKCAALVEMRAGGVDELTIEEVPFIQNMAAMQNGMRLEEHNSVNMGFNDVYPQYREAYAYIFPENDVKTAEEFGLGLAGKVAYSINLPVSPIRDDVEAVSTFLNENLEGQGK